MRKKAQVWSVDMIAGLTIFLITMTIYFAWTNNLYDTSNSDFEDLYQEATILTDTLILTAQNNLTNGTEPGITNLNYRLNTTLLDNISEMPYSTLKHNLKTKYDFLIFFENRTGNITTINGTTYLGITKDEPLITKNNVKTKTNLKNMLAVKRYLILDSEIITMVTYIWN